MKIIECLGWFNHEKTRKELLRTIMEEPYTSVVLMGVGKYCQLVQQDTSPLPTDREIKATIRGHDSEKALMGCLTCGGGTRRRQEKNSQRSNKS